MSHLLPASFNVDEMFLTRRIVDIVSPARDSVFYDVCCGSGAVSLELVRRGHDPSKIRMIDRSPWGLFWKLVGQGRFDIDRFCLMCLAVKNSHKHVHDIANTPAYVDTPYVFIFLQAMSANPVGIDYNYRWINYRHHKRAPHPMDLCNRVALICEKMCGVKGYMQGVFDVEPEYPSTIYIDPRKSIHTFDIFKYANYIRKPCLASESKPLSDMAYLIGQDKRGREEWLSAL